MTAKRFGFMVLSLMVCLLGCSASSLGWADSPTIRPQVTVTHEDGSLKTIQAEVLVNAPVEMVWQALSDYGNLKHLFPGYERSTVLQSTGNLKTVDLQVKASSLLPAFRYQVRIRENKPAYHLQIQRIAGDFKAINATYQLIPTDGGTRTRVLYNLSMDMGNALPPFGIASVLKASTARSMAAIQSHCSDVYRRSLTAQAVR